MISRCDGQRRSIKDCHPLILAHPRLPPSWKVRSQLRKPLHQGGSDGRLVSGADRRECPADVSDSDCPDFDPALGGESRCFGDQPTRAIAATAAGGRAAFDDQPMWTIEVEERAQLVGGTIPVLPQSPVDEAVRRLKDDKAEPARGRINGEETLPAFSAFHRSVS
jgi:hypothetical protein